jgi:aminopeptidase N
VVNNLDFSVTYPADRTLVLSGERVGSLNNGDGTKTDSWVFAHPLHWHVSLVLAEYEMVSGACGSTAVEVYGMPIESEYPIVPATYVPVLESICENFRARFGEPAFSTIRLAGVDERFTNGYSSPTLIIVPNYTLDDDGTGSFAARDFYLAHEFSHQWWGNDVFMGSMADAWLTEGMADYSAITYLKDSWGDEQAQYFWLDDAAFLLDYYRQGGRDHALVPVDSAGMEPVIYYLKGAWVLRMLQWVIGEGPMGAALRSYREAHPFSAATTQDFVDAAEAAGGEDLGWFFGQWLYGTGVMSLGETHRDAGGDVEVTVSQHTPWSAHPERFFQMPLTIRIESGKKSTDHLVTVSGAESTCVLEKP